MRKRKWFIPVIVASVLLIGGIVGGVVVAADDSSSNIEDQSQATDRNQALLDRACAIYEEETGITIDAEQLKDALKQARSEIQDEALEIAGAWQARSRWWHDAWWMFSALGCSRYYR